MRIKIWEGCKMVFWLFKTVTSLFKGQLISKANQSNRGFSQKTNEKTRRIVVKTNSFVRFLGESSAWQFAFEINWPLNNIPGELIFFVNLWEKFQLGSLCHFKGPTKRTLTVANKFNLDNFLYLHCSNLVSWLLSLTWNEHKWFFVIHNGAKGFLTMNFNIYMSMQKVRTLSYVKVKKV